MSTQMPARICKGDKVRIKEQTKAKVYGVDNDRVFTVSLIDKVGGSPRLYVEHPARPGEPFMVWARDVVLAWGKSSQERREALGL
jgi:hypothetical protein